MKKVLFLLALVASLFVIMPSLANATSLTFDDLPGTYGTMPSPHDGFNWTNFSYNKNPNLVFNNSSVGTIATANKATFDFTSNYFVSGFTSTDFIVSGFKNGSTVPLFVDAFIGTNQGKLSFSGMDSLVVASNQPVEFTNVNYKVNGGPVPEPSSILLSAMGFMSFIFGFRRKLFANI